MLLLHLLRACYHGDGSTTHVVKASFSALLHLLHQKHIPLCARATPGPHSVKQPAPEKAAEAPPEKPAEVEEPAKEPAAAEPVVVKGVEFANPAAAVAFVNRCDADALDEVGIKGKAQQLVLEVAPIDSVEDLAVPGIGRRTLQSLAGVGRE